MLSRIIQGAACNSIVKVVHHQITRPIRIQKVQLQIRLKCKGQRHSRCIILRNTNKIKLLTNIINLINNINSSQIEIMDTTTITTPFKYLGWVKIKWFRKETLFMLQGNPKAQINRMDKIWGVYNIFCKAQVNWVIMDPTVLHQLDLVQV